MMGMRRNPQLPGGGALSKPREGSNSKGEFDPTGIGAGRNSVLLNSVAGSRRSAITDSNEVASSAGASERSLLRVEGHTVSRIELCGKAAERLEREEAGRGLGGCDNEGEKGDGGSFGENVGGGGASGFGPSGAKCNCDAKWGKVQAQPPSGRMDVYHPATGGCVHLSGERCRWVPALPSAGITRGDALASAPGCVAFVPTTNEKVHGEILEGVDEREDGGEEDEVSPRETSNSGGGTPVWGSEDGVGLERSCGWDSASDPALDSGTQIHPREEGDDGRDELGRKEWMRVYDEVAEILREEDEGFDVLRSAFALRRAEREEAEWEQPGVWYAGSVAGVLADVGMRVDKWESELRERLLRSMWRRGGVLAEHLCGLLGRATTAWVSTAGKAESSSVGVELGGGEEQEIEGVARRAARQWGEGALRVVRLRVFERKEFQQDGEMLRGSELLEWIPKRPLITSTPRKRKLVIPSPQELPEGKQRKGTRQRQDRKQAKAIQALAERRRRGLWQPPRVREWRALADTTTDDDFQNDGSRPSRSNGGIPLSPPGLVRNLQGYVAWHQRVRPVAKDKLTPAQLEKAPAVAPDSDGASVQSPYQTQGSSQESASSAEILGSQESVRWKEEEDGTEGGQETDGGWQRGEANKGKRVRWGRQTYVGKPDLRPMGMEETAETRKWVETEWLLWPMEGWTTGEQGDSWVWTSNTWNGWARRLDLSTGKWSGCQSAGGRSLETGMVLALGATLQRYRNKQLLQWIREIRLTARAVRTLRARFGADVQDEDRPSDEELGPDSMDEAEPEDGVGDGENRGGRQERTEGGEIERDREDDEGSEEEPELTEAAVSSLTQQVLQHRERLANFRVREMRGGDTERGRREDLREKGNVELGEVAAADTRQEPTEGSRYAGSPAASDGQCREGDLAGTRKGLNFWLVEDSLSEDEGERGSKAAGAVGGMTIHTQKRQGATRRDREAESGRGGRDRAPPEEDDSEADFSDGTRKRWREIEAQGCVLSAGASSRQEGKHRKQDIRREGKTDRARGRGARRDD